MTSLVLGAATTALQMKTGIAHIDNQPSGNLQGRKVSHWPFILFIASSVVGVIAAIAGFVIGGLGVALLGYVIGMGGVLLAVVAGLGAYYAKKFATLNTLEGYVKILSERLKMFATTISQLKEANNELEKVNMGIKQIPADWKKEIENGKKQMDAKNEELKKTIGKLNTVQKKFEQLALVTQQLQKQTGELSKSVFDFTKENGIAGDHIETLKGQIEGLDQENNELMNQIKNLDAENDQAEIILGIYSKNNKALQDLHQLMQELYLQTTQKMKDLETEVDSLKTVVQEAKASSENLGQISKDYQEWIKKFTSLEQLAELYKKGHERWTAFVNSAEYSNYMEWKKHKKVGDAQ